MQILFMPQVVNQWPASTGHSGYRTSESSPPPQDIEANAMTGDPEKIAAVIFQTTRQTHPPLRLTLGDDSYGAVHAALSGRLAALENQRAVAESISFGR